MRLRREIIYKKEWWVVFFILGFFLRLPGLFSLPDVWLVLLDHGHLSLRLPVDGAGKTALGAAPDDQGGELAC